VKNAEKEHKKVRWMHPTRHTFRNRILRSASNDGMTKFSAFLFWDFKVARYVVEIFCCNEEENP